MRYFIYTNGSSMNLASGSSIDYYHKVVDVFFQQEIIWERNVLCLQAKSLCFESGFNRLEEYVFHQTTTDAAMTLFSFFLH